MDICNDYIVSSTTLRIHNSVIVTNYTDIFIYKYLDTHFILNKIKKER